MAVCVSVLSLLVLCFCSQGFRIYIEPAEILLGARGVWNDAVMSTHARIAQVGSGVQLLCALFVALLIAAAGLLPREVPGALLVAAFGAGLLVAPLAGYVAVRVWADMLRNTEGWASVCFKTAFWIPGVAR